MRPTRRELLRMGTALTLLSCARGAQGGRAAEAPVRLLLDERLRGAAALAEHARLAGLAVTQTGGEIIHRLHELGALAPGFCGRLIGVTHHVDYALARDALRRTASPVRQALVLERDHGYRADGWCREAPQERALLADLARRLPPASARRYLWLA